MPFEQEDVDRSEGLGAAHGCASPGGLGHKGEKFYLYGVSFLLLFVQRDLTRWKFLSHVTK